MAYFIRGATIVAMGGKQGSVSFTGDVLIEGDRIAAIGAGLTAPAGATIIDGSGKLVMPGLVNAHLHSGEALFKSRYDNMPLEIWMLYAYPILGAKAISDRLIYLRSMLVAIEASIAAEGFHRPRAATVERVVHGSNHFVDCNFGVAVAVACPTALERFRPEHDRDQPDHLVDGHFTEAIAVTRTRRDERLRQRRGCCECQCDWHRNVAHRRLITEAQGRCDDPVADIDRAVFTIASRSRRSRSRICDRPALPSRVVPAPVALVTAWIASSSIVEPMRASSSAASEPEGNADAWLAPNSRTRMSISYRLVS